MNENYRLIEIKSKAEQKEFNNFPARLYKNDPFYIRPLNSDIDSVFDEQKNRLFREGGKAVRWLLKNKQNKTVGRVAAFVDVTTANLNPQPTGGMGFFDCINNQEAANCLFDACKQWLAANGMEAMDGPINFGSREHWWGLLVDGFTEPSYGMNYNFPYYKELFENYGFKNYFNQYSYLRPISMDNLSEALVHKAERIFKNPEYRFENLSLKKIDEAAEMFRTIYNRSWVLHDGIAEMTREQTQGLVNMLKPVIDEKLILFAFHNNEPIGFFIQIPEINQVIKYLNGKFSLYHKLKFLYLLKVRKKCDRVLGLIFAIVPEFRSKGIEGALCMKFGETAFSKDFQYKDIDLTWVGDFNPLMMRFQAQIGGKIYKTHVTYRLLFDEYKQQNEFERCPRMGSKEKKDTENKE